MIQIKKIFLLTVILATVSQSPLVFAERDSGGGHKVEQLFATARLTSLELLENLNLRVLAKTGMDDSAVDWLTHKQEGVYNLSLLKMQIGKLEFAFQKQFCPDSKPISYLGILNGKPTVCVSRDGFSDEKGEPTISPLEAQGYVFREAVHACGVPNENLAGIVSVAINSLHTPLGYYFLKEGEYESTSNGTPTITFGSIGSDRRFSIEFKGNYSIFVRMSCVFDHSYNSDGKTFNCRSLSDTYFGELYITILADGSIRPYSGSFGADYYSNLNYGALYRPKSL